jgi:hypothetical protein
MSTDPPADAADVEDEEAARKRRNREYQREYQRALRARDGDRVREYAR